MFVLAPKNETSIIFSNKNAFFKRDWWTSCNIYFQIARSRMAQRYGMHFEDDECSVKLFNYVLDKANVEHKNSILKDTTDMNNKTYYELNEMLGDATSHDDIKQICELFCEKVQFEYYIFAICSATSLSAPEITSVSNYPPEWYASYFEEGLQKHDPVVKYCFEHTTPIRWDKLLCMEEYITPMAEQVMQKAAVIGLVNGISIPLKAPSGEISILSISTSSADNIEARMMEALPHALSFGNALFECCARLNASNNTEKSNRLTSREIECLFWACEGKTTWEISKIIDVTERTIIFHLTSATKKLGAVNRQHAVAKAIITGLVKPTP